jgi:hypothetical protein
MTVSKDRPSWTGLKAKLADLDRPGLVSLVQALYAASKDNQAFLHARFGLGEDVLKPYKATIERWISPDVYKNQDTSVAKAKKAISDYKKAIGRPEAMAELMVFYCELAGGFASEYGLDDQSYLDAMVRMYAQALKVIVTLPEEPRDELIGRLDVVRHVCHRNVACGVPEEMDALLGHYGVDD